MPKKPKTPPRKPKPLYRQKPARRGRDVASALRADSIEPKARPYTDFPHAHPIPSPHFELRDDGSIQSATETPRRGEKTEFTKLTELKNPAENNPENPVNSVSRLPQLIFHDAGHRLWLYHGNSLELLDAISAKYPEGRFDCIFADPPYFLSNGGITCHAGRMVRVDKGDWDISRGPELNHEFNLEWLRRCQRVLKPNGTLWVSGTHHVIFSIGYAMQQLGYKILNDIAWEKPNPPPNLSCRYFTHSTETILWAAKNEKSKHVFNYQDMRKVTGKQMKTVWRKSEFLGSATAPVAPVDASSTGISSCEAQDETRGARVLPENIWTLGAPGNDEKTYGKHPTQKPVALVERCLLASTHEGDLVLDPFLGGGTTAIAAIKLKRGCVGIELDDAHVKLAAKRIDGEIILIWLRHFRVRMEIFVFIQNDLDLFSDSINGSRSMADVPQIETDRIYHETKFVFLSCAEVQRGSVVHTTIEVSLQEAWAKTPNGKKRETTHVVRCETEIFRLKN